MFWFLSYKKQNFNIQKHGFVFKSLQEGIVGANPLLYKYPQEPLSSPKSGTFCRRAWRRVTSAHWRILHCVCVCVWHCIYGNMTSFVTRVKSPRDNGRGCEHVTLGHRANRCDSVTLVTFLHPPSSSATISYFILDNIKWNWLGLGVTWKVTWKPFPMFFFFNGIMLMTYYAM